MSYLHLLNNKTIGIIGIGYIGYNLFNFLNKEKQNRNIRLITFNRINTSEIKKYEFDYFFNCTGNTGDFRTNPLETINSNITLTSYLLDNLRVKESYLALSSTRLYGFSSTPDNIFYENDFEKKCHLNIDFIYNGSKKLMESMLVNFKPKNSCKYSIVRPSNVIGNFKTSELNDETLFKTMVKSSLNSQILNIGQHEFSSKDYIHINDLVIGIIRAALLADKSDIFNIAYGKSFSLNEISQLLNLQSFFQNDTAPSYSNISIEKSKRILGFEPSIKIETLSLEEILEST